MPYVLGIDVGSANTTAALCRLDGSAWQEAEVARLTSRSATVGSLLYLAEDGATVVGDEARQRALAEPSRIAQGFLRRIGDDVPVVAGGEQYAAAELTGLLVGWVIEVVAVTEGRRPDHVVLTHPGDWGAHRRGLLLAELQVQGLTEVSLLPEPIAAAESYASRGRLDPGNALAVHGIGAAHTTAAILRRNRTGEFELLGTAAGAAGDADAEQFAGTHFDDLLLEHVRTELGKPGELDLADPQLRPVLTRLREECAQAKVALSTAAEVSIAVALPGLNTEIRLGRPVFEELIRPSLRAAAERLPTALRYCGLPADDLAAVVLTGGSARIPLVAELLAEVVDCRISVEHEPEHTVAKGAALAARRLAARRRGRVALPGPEQQTRLLPRIDGGVAPRPRTSLDAPADDFAEPPSRPDIEVRPLALPQPRSTAEMIPWLRPGVLGALVLVVIVVGVVITFTLHIGIGTSPASPAGGGSGGSAGLTSPAPRGDDPASTAPSPPGGN